MQTRRNLLPRAAADIGCFLLVFIFVPVTFVFELAVVLPDFHDTGGVLYVLTWIAGVFILTNIVGNMLACMMVDTSIKSVLLQPPIKPSLRKQWHFCADCETLVPPRSWHCGTCRTCILKRDHHCLFTGCCVGHRNQRYFLLFMIYIAIGSTYTTIYNSVYFWWLHADTYANINTAIKMVFPMLMLITDVSRRNLYLLIYELNVIAMLYSSVLVIYHLPSILVGSVAYERKTPKYNLGWRRNLEQVLGKRMRLVWLSPFISSELPHDGIDWGSIQQQSTKNR